MLSSTDFNNAVPQFTNGNYASNPLNPQYIAEPSSTDYNRGVEPIKTLPAQWWNWFLNKFTSRFNKLNIYVKNIFNELTQLLSLAEITPDGTENDPTVGQLKTMFECCYPNYVKEAKGLVPNTTCVNGHPLSSNVTVTRSDLELGTSATVNTGTAAGCIPLVGTALGTTDNNIVMTDANGKLKPSGVTTGTAAGNIPLIGTALGSTNNNIVLTDANGKLKPSGTVIGSAAGCDASCFRASSWTPSYVACAGLLCRTGYATAYDFDVALTNNCTTAAGQTLYVSASCRLKYCNTTGVLKAVAFCGAVYGCACCAGRDGSGCTFGTAARYACGCFRPSTWTPTCVACAWKVYDGITNSCTAYSILLGLCNCASGYNEVYKSNRFYYVDYGNYHSSIDVNGGGYTVTCAETWVEGRVNYCCSANVECCYCYSCTGIGIRPTIYNTTCFEGDTCIRTYTFDGKKTTVCALRKKLHDMFSITPDASYCYVSEYTCSLGEPVIGYVCTNGKRTPISGVRFMTNYNGIIALTGSDGSSYMRLYNSCGACLICSCPGITCLRITTLFGNE